MQRTRHLAEQSGTQCVTNVLVSFHTLTSTAFRQLKKTYEVVEKLRNLSGCTWDDTHGAQINPDKKAVWDVYVLSNPKASAFKKKGWPFRKSMAAIFAPKVTGTHVYDPSTGNQGYDDTPGVTPAEKEPDGASEDSELSSVPDEAEPREMVRSKH